MFPRLSWSPVSIPKCMCIVGQLGQQADTRVPIRLQWSPNLTPLATVPIKPSITFGQGFLTLLCYPSARKNRLELTPCPFHHPLQHVHILMASASSPCTELDGKRLLPQLTENS